MRNDDSVSVEELDWSAESQVSIPAEHFWCDFKCRLNQLNSNNLLQQFQHVKTFYIYNSLLHPIVLGLNC